MRIVSAAEVERALEETSLVERLREMFRAGCVMPVRTHQPAKVPGEPDAMLFFMPAWQEGRHIGVKLVTVFPGNAERSLPSVQGVYLLLDGRSGTVLAIWTRQC